MDTDGDITRSDYQHTAIQRLELGIDDGNDVAWAQVMGPYLIYYDTKTELMYSCNLDVGTIVLLDFDGVAARQVFAEMEIGSMVCMMESLQRFVQMEASFKLFMSQMIH